MDQRNGPSWLVNENEMEVFTSWENRGWVNPDRTALQETKWLMSWISPIKTQSLLLVLQSFPAIYKLTMVQEDMVHI